MITKRSFPEKPARKGCLNPIWRPPNDEVKPSVQQNITLWAYGYYMVPGIVQIKIFSLIVPSYKLTTTQNTHCPLLAYSTSNPTQQITSTSLSYCTLRLSPLYRYYNSFCHFWSGKRTSTALPHLLIASILFLLHTVPSLWTFLFFWFLEGQWMDITYFEVVTRLRTLYS